MTTTTTRPPSSSWCAPGRRDLRLRFDPAARRRVRCPDGRRLRDPGRGRQRGSRGPVLTTSVADLREAELRAAAAHWASRTSTCSTSPTRAWTARPRDDTLCGAPYPSVVEAVRRAVEGHDPDVVVTLDGSDGHRDHARIRDAVVDAVASMEVRLYLQGLPRSLMHQWVRLNAGDASAAAYVDLPDIGTPDERFTTVVDTSAHLTVREGVIALHRSQTSPYDGLPDGLKRAFLDVRAPDPAQSDVDRRRGRARHLRRPWQPDARGDRELHPVISLETAALPCPCRPSGRSRTSATRKQDLQVLGLTVAGDPAAERLGHLAGLGDAGAGLGPRRREPLATTPAGIRIRRWSCSARNVIPTGPLPPARCRRGPGRGCARRGRA